MAGIISKLRHLIHSIIPGSGLPFVRGQEIASSHHAEAAEVWLRNGLRVNEVFAGLDIGTTAIHTVIGRAMFDGSIKLLGMGHSKSKGWRMGEVVSQEDALASLRGSIEIAERAAGIRLPPVVLGIDGEFIDRVVVSKPRMTVTGFEGGDNGSANGNGRRIIHLHHRKSVMNTASSALMVSAPNRAVDRCLACVRAAGVRIKEVHWSPVALGQSLLESDQSKDNVLLLDIGGLQTSAVVYHDGRLHDAFSIRIGGDEITNDLSIAFGTTVKEAEYLKRTFGVASEKASYGYQQLELPQSLSSRYDLEVIYHIHLARVIQQRLQYIFSQVQRQLMDDMGLDYQPDVVFLTGGGAAIRGVEQLATDCFRTAAKLAGPQGIAGMPDDVSALRLTAAVGLLKIHGVQEITGYRPSTADAKGLKRILKPWHFPWSKNYDKGSHKVH